MAAPGRIISGRDHGGHDGEPFSWRKHPIAGGIALLVILGILVIYGYRSTANSRAADEEIAREHAYDRAKMVYLGQYLARNNMGRRVFLLLPTPHNTYSTERNRTMVEALEEGLGKDLALTFQESPPVSGNTDRESPSDPVEVETFDAIIEKHSDCDVIITVSSLPFDYEELKLWRIPSSSRPKLVVVDVVPSVLKKLLKEKRAVAGVVRNQDWKYDREEVVPDDIEEAFNKRFVLLKP